MYIRKFSLVLVLVVLLSGVVGVTAVAQAQSDDEVDFGIFDTLSVDLKVDGRDGPLTVAKSAKVLATWESEGAEYCTGSWKKGKLGISGSQRGSISKSVVISVTCFGDGETVRDSVAVQISGKETVFSKRDIAKVRAELQKLFTTYRDELTVKLDNEIVEMRKNVQRTELLKDFERRTAEVVSEFRSRVNTLETDLQSAFASPDFIRGDAKFINKLRAEIPNAFEDLKERTGKDLGEIAQEIERQQQKETASISFVTYRADGRQEDEFFLSVTDRNGNPVQLDTASFPRLPVGEYRVVASVGNDRAQFTAQVRADGINLYEAESGKSVAEFKIRGPQVLMTIYDGGDPDTATFEVWNGGTRISPSTSGGTGPFYAVQYGVAHILKVQHDGGVESVSVTAQSSRRFEVREIAHQYEPIPPPTPVPPPTPPVPETPPVATLSPITLRVQNSAGTILESPRMKLSVTSRDGKAMRLNPLAFPGLPLGTGYKVILETTENNRTDRVLADLEVTSSMYRVRTTNGNETFEIFFNDGEYARMVLNDGGNIYNYNIRIKNSNGQPLRVSPGAGGPYFPLTSGLSYILDATQVHSDGERSEGKFSFKADQYGFVFTEEPTTPVPPLVSTTPKSAVLEKIDSPSAPAGERVLLSGSGFSRDGVKNVVYLRYTNHQWFKILLSDYSPYGTTLGVPIAADIPPGNYEIVVNNGIGLSNILPFTIQASGTSSKPSVKVLSINNAANYSSISNPPERIPVEAEVYGAVTKGDLKLYFVRSTGENETSSNALFQCGVEEFDPAKGTPRNSCIQEASGFGSGTFYILAVWTDTSGNRAIDYSDAPFTITGPVDKIPVGYLDGVSCTEISGWAYDPDVPGEAISVKLFADGDDTKFYTNTTQLVREDVNIAKGISGPHGFSWSPLGTLDVLDERPHQIYAYAVSRGPSANGAMTQLQNSPLTLDCFGSQPDKKSVGYLDGADCSAISGWTYDPDHPSDSSNVYLYADGPADSGGTRLVGGDTSLSRPDVNAAKGITGNHGFSIETPASLKDGKAHTIYVYGGHGASESSLGQLGQSPKTIQCGTASAFGFPALLNLSGAAAIGDLFSYPAFR